MSIHFNTMLKNEEDLLLHILPIWAKYSIDKFVFYNDNSTDKSVEVITSLLPAEKIKIIENDGRDFNESRNRASMLDFSRNNGAEYTLAIDCDELLSANFVSNFSSIIPHYKEHNLLLYWYNVVDGTLGKTRQDPEYLNNYRSFVLPTAHTGNFDLNQWKYHTPRTPPVNLPSCKTKSIGVIHLQALNRKFYAFKQMWYKHHEFVKYNHPADYINARYDSVVNKLNFNSIDTPLDIIGDISIDSGIFDKMLDKKGYGQFIKENYNKELITFGQEYFENL